MIYKSSAVARNQHNKISLWKVTCSTNHETWDTEMGVNCKSSIPNFFTSSDVLVSSITSEDGAASTLDAGTSTVTGGCEVFCVCSEGDKTLVGAACVAAGNGNGNPPGNIGLLNCPLCGAA